jgi:glutamate---cysteine ligase / carboxylate-amine ligase
VTHRKIGVEEEFMLVDPDTGRLRAVSGQALRAHRQEIATNQDDPPGQVEQELYLQQIEIGTPPVRGMSELAQELRTAREAVDRAAAAVGVHVVATGTPVLAGEDHVTPKPRYHRMVDQLGEVARESTVCGMHVHIDIVDENEGVVALDYLRPWLPVLRALTVNSPFWLGRDTKFASWRTQVWNRWPATGPAEPFGSVEGYRAATQQLLASGASFDRAMLYLDARLSARYPTIEIRVADVCTEIDDILLFAALSRALVEMSSRPNSSGPDVVARSDALRAAHWRASRYGLSDRLVSPLTQELIKARAIVEATIDAARDALDDAGDTELVETCFERLMARGPGATRQRAMAESTGTLEAVVEDLHRRFVASWERDL